MLLVSVCASQQDVAVQPYLFTPSSSPLVLTPVECASPPDVCISRFLMQHVAMVRVYASLPLHITTVKNRECFIPSRNAESLLLLLLPLFVVEKPISSLLQRIKSQPCQFLFSSEQVMLSDNSKGTLRTLLPERFKAAAKHHHSSDRYMAHTLDRPLLLELLESTASPLVTNLPTAPTLRFGEPLSEGCIQVTLPVDILGLIHWDTTAVDVSTLLKDTICAQLQAMKDEMLWMV